MRKLLTGAVAASATLALSAGAGAQVQSPAGDATLDVSARPSDSGTRADPKNVALGFKMTVARPGTTVEIVEVRLPRGLKFSGKGFKACDAEALQFEGPGACPRGSSIGSVGSASALIEPGNSPLNFTVNAFAGGASTFLFHLAEPGGVQAVVPGAISNRGRRLRITIPLSLRQPLPGLDATLTGLDYTFNKKAGRNYVVTSRNCKNRRWAVTGALTFATRANGTPGPAPQALTEKVRCSK